MSLIANVRLHGNLILFEATFEREPAANCTFADFHSVEQPTGERGYVFFWWVDGCDLDSFEDALGGDDTVEGFRRIGTVGSRGLYRIESRSFEPSQPLVFPLFRDNDITEIETKRNVDGLHIHARFPSRLALDVFLDATEQIATHTELERLYSESADNPERLTRRQREAVVLAYERGYFAVPKQVTLTELAEELEITQQTLSRHLRVGVQKLLHTAVGSMET